MGSSMKDAAMQPLLFRSVIGRILSIIYFPFWVIEMEMPWKLHLDDRRRRLTVGSQTRRAPSIYSILNQAQQSESTIVGFRPLCCPNCGWDLPLRPDEYNLFLFVMRQGMANIWQ